jgi:hypothetical protein
MNTHKTTMLGVTEYCEGLDVSLERTSGVYCHGLPEEQWLGRGRLVIQALNEGGYNATQIDLVQLIKWLRANRPELLAQ